MVRLIWFLSFEIHPYKILFLLLRRPIAHMDGWHAKYPSHNLYQRTLPNDTKKSCFAICKFNFHIKMKKYQSKLPGAQMNPWPSLSKTLNASLISSSISVSWISLKKTKEFLSRVSFLKTVHLVMSQTNSLKLIEPFPSWSISPISSWKTRFKGCFSSPFRKGEKIFFTCSSKSEGLQPKVRITFWIKNRWWGGEILPLKGNFKI